MKKQWWIVLAIALVCACPPLRSQDRGQQVIEQALQPSPLQQNLRQLTDEVGGRIPGTPAMDRALQWGVSALQQAGAEDVHTEEFPMPLQWAEGNSTMDVSAGEARFALRVVSIAWSPATHGVLRGPVVDIGDGTQADFARAGNLNGAILLVHSNTMRSWDDLFAEYLRGPGIYQRAKSGGAAAIAFISTREHDLLYRHIPKLNGTLAELPSVIVAREDGLRIARLLETGKAVEASLSLPNFVGRGRTTQNVVAELRGNERPQEWVLLGAHLDSWELGTGALDNGANAALVVDALRAIRASGLRPRRSLRFVLFSGEEEGMLGSLAYVRAHQDELDGCVGMVVFDEGTGPVTGFSLGGRGDLKAAMAQLIGPLARFGAVELTTDAFVGTDNFDFLLEGVPTFVANQKEANYLVNYHASSDTYDKVDVKQLRRNVAIAAYTAFALADAPQRVGARQSRPQIEQLMQQTGLDEQLKIFDLWQEWTAGQRGRK